MYVCPKYCMGQAYMKRLFVANLKFKFILVLVYPAFLFAKSGNYFKGIIFVFPNDIVAILGTQLSPKIPSFHRLALRLLKWISQL